MSNEFWVMTSSGDAGECGLYLGQELKVSSWALDRAGYDPYQMQGWSQRKLAEVVAKLAPTWTVERVKEELPEVKVKIDKEICTCRIAGRKNRFATIWLPVGSIECSWETLARCLNLDRPVLV